MQNVLVHSSMQETILFFTPEAGVRPHFAAQCILARTMKERGHSILMTHCSGIFSRCPVMDMYQLPYDSSPEQKSQVCNICSGAFNEMVFSYGLEFVELSDYISEKSLQSISQIVANAPHDLRLFNFEGLPFGNICAYDAILSLKHYNLEKVDGSFRQAWITYIEAALQSYFMADCLIRQFQARHLLRFNDYSLLVGASFAASKNGISAQSVTLAPHKSVDFQRFSICNTTIIYDTYVQSIKKWWQWRDLCLQSEQVKLVVDDMISRYGGCHSHVFSPAKTFGESCVLTRLSLSKERKTIVAFTSSYDEIAAMQVLKEGLGAAVSVSQNTFPDQISWLKSVIEYVEQSPELQLVVRIHPREGKGRASEHLNQLYKVFDQPIERCRFIWPDDSISSYDLAEVTDLALISWSTIGLELARIGVPVLAMNRGTSYPGDDFIEWAETPQEFFNKCSELLVKAPQLQTFAHAFRYYSCFNLSNSLSLADIIPDSNVTFDYKGLPPFKYPKEAETLEEVIICSKSIFDINYHRQISLQHAGLEIEETNALRLQIWRIIHYICTGVDDSADIPLTVIEDDIGAPDICIKRDANERLIIVAQSEITYMPEPGISIRKFSPTCARLARLSVVADRLYSQSLRANVKRPRNVSKCYEPSELLTTADQFFNLGDYAAAVDCFELLLEMFPQAATSILSKLSELYLSIPQQDRFTLYVSRFYDFDIKPTDKVLDIGSGNLPFPLATHLADIALTNDSVGRAGVPFKHLNGKPVYECNLENLSFANQEFDFVYCSHVLEHVSSPEKACNELMRVGKRGYIETPTRGKDLWLNTAKISNHRWAIELFNDTLIFTEYSLDDIEGLNCGILLDMHSTPQNEREKAFSALVNLRANKLNTMLYWEGSFKYEVRRLKDKAVSANSNTGQTELVTLGQMDHSTAKKVVFPSCVFLNTYYSGFIQTLYRQHPHLAQAAYAEQHQTLQQALFGDSDFYSRGMATAGWNTYDLIVNVELLQQAWGAENGFTGNGHAIALAQLDKIRSDVLYIQDMHLVSAEFLVAVRPLVKLIVGQIASPFGPHIPITLYDIVITSFPHYVERFRQMGVTTYYQPLAFEPRVLNSVRSLPFAARPIDCSFVGGISALHTTGTRLLEVLVTTTPLRIWGYGAESLPAGSVLRQRHQGEVWGSEMFAVLASSRITVNRHVDVAENYANNMRLFEATGCGALLITDYKDNLHELFEIGTEVVVYRSVEECAELVNYYLVHPAEAEAIAKAGQRRTLREHNYTQRMEKTAELLERHLQYRVEADMLRLPDRISDGHQAIDRSEITTAMTSAWLSPEIPSRQRALVQHELAEMYRGTPGTPFRVLAEILKPLVRNHLTVLEIGCASGYYYEVLEYLLSKQLHYTGVDYSQPMIDMARQYYPKATFFCSDGANLFFADRQFEVVISSCVLLHVPNYRQHIFETTRVAQCHVVVSRTPICKRQATQYLKKFAYGIETVELVFNERELLYEFELNGFRLQKAIEYQADLQNDRFETTYLLARG